MSNLRLENLTITYRRLPAVHHISGEFVAGAANAIVGPNGAGKSSLLKALMGLADCSEGVIHSACPAHKLAYLPQQSEIDRHFPIRVQDVLVYGFWRSLGWLAGLRAIQRQKMYQALERVGLTGFEKRYIHELSVGQFQRVLFARLMLQEADVILLDEPFAALDSKTCLALLDIIQSWVQEGKMVIAVLHDIQQVREVFDYTLILARETIAWGATAEVLTVENLQRANQVVLYQEEHATVCDSLRTSS